MPKADTEKAFEFDIQAINIKLARGEISLNEATEQHMSLIKANCWLKGEQEVPLSKSHLSLQEIRGLNLKPCREWKK